MSNSTLKQQQEQTVSIEDTGKMLEATNLYKEACALENDLEKQFELRLSAKDLALSVLANDPENTDALNLLGRILLDSNEIVEAEKVTSLAKGLLPHSDIANLNSGYVHIAKKEWSLAQACFMQALSINPKSTNAESALAYTKVKQGDLTSGFSMYRGLVRRGIINEHIKNQLVDCCKFLTADYYAEDLEKDILQYLSFENVDYEKLSPLVTSLIIHKYELSKSDAPLNLDAISEDPLVIQSLEKMPFFHPATEDLFTALRHCILIESVGNNKLREEHFELTRALTHYFNRNEYVNTVSEGEATIVDQLHTLVSNLLTSPSWTVVDVVPGILLLGMYNDLTQVNNIDEIEAVHIKVWPDYIQDTLQLCYYDVIEFEKTKEAVSDINQANMTDIAQQVKAQYEQNPYPRWTSLGTASKQDYMTTLESELPAFATPERLRQATESLNILIAGCGTGRHAARTATFFNHVNVDAIDFSRSSVSYAKFQSQRYGIRNLLLECQDILNLEADKQYDVVECSGVLHHMQSPQEGLDKLLNVLKDDGVMKLALYSEFARQNIVRIRQYILENGLQPTANDIRALRQAVLTNEIEGDFTDILSSPDFYSISGCRDMLFNIKEHRFTAKQIKAMCEANNLTFLGFTNLPMHVVNSYKEMFTNDPNMVKLENWHMFETENPGTFGNMYQFYCSKA